MIFFSCFFLNMDVAEGEFAVVARRQEGRRQEAGVEEGNHGDNDRARNGTERGGADGLALCADETGRHS